MNCQVSDGRRRWLRTSIAGRYRASARQVFFGESEVPQRPVEGRHERVRMGQVFLATFWDFLSNRRPAASAVISAARHRSAGRDRMLPSRPPSKRRAAAISTAIVSQSFYAGCDRDGSSVSRKRSREPKTSVPRRVVDSTGSLEVSRNTVRKYLGDSGEPRGRARPRRSGTLAQICPLTATDVASSIDSGRFGPPQTRCRRIWTRRAE